MDASGAWPLLTQLKSCVGKLEQEFQSGGEPIADSNGVLHEFWLVLERVVSHRNKGSGYWKWVSRLPLLRPLLLLSRARAKLWSIRRHLGPGALQILQPLFGRLVVGSAASCGLGPEQDIGGQRSPLLAHLSPNQDVG